MSRTEQIDVPVKVTFVGGEASSIQYFNTTHGVMDFDVRDGVAVLDADNDRLRDGTLKEQFDRTLTTGDVLRAVEALSFIEDIALSEDVAAASEEDT